MKVGVISNMFLPRVSKAIGKISIVRERRNQVKLSETAGISKVAVVKMRDDSILVSQEFGDSPPVALVLAFHNRELARYGVRPVTRLNGARTVESTLPLSELEKAYAKAREIAAEDSDTLAGDEQETLHLQLAWVCVDGEHPVPDRLIKGVVRDGLLFRERGPNLTGEPREVFCWAGNASETILPKERRITRNGLTIELRGNRFNQLILVAGAAEATRVTSFADSIDVVGNRLTVHGRVGTLSGAIGTAALVFVGHTSGTVFEGPADLSLDEVWTLHDAGRQMYTYTAFVDFNADQYAHDAGSENFDAFLRITDRYTGEQSDARIARVPFLARLFHNSATAADGDSALSISPYFTFKAKALSATIDFFSSRVGKLLSPSAALVRKLRAERNGKPSVWLIGELAYKAQDNGMHFFKWMRRHHPEIDAYYVIRKDSPERANLEFFDHVIDHGSPEHFTLALQAEKFIGTHHADYLYPTQNPEFVKHLRGTRVFLQHGVMGTKWMVPNYGKYAPGFSTDLFLASSEYEKQYLVSDFGYDEDEVMVTGLSRFDVLLDPPIQREPGTLLVMPTWRDWLRSNTDFEGTEYFQLWHGLLTSPEFVQLIHEYNLKVKLCLHPNMQQYSDMFEGIPGEVVYQGMEDVQSLMMRSSCMLTDYSSVGFDFSFQHRPVIYYQFDRDQFIGDFGSHIDLDEELPGYVCQSRESVLEHLRELATSDFVQPTHLRKRADRFLDYRDARNSERVFAAISGVSHTQSHVRGHGRAEVRGVLFNRFRRSGSYYPLMKLMYRCARLLPRKPGLTVFESHNGKQYSDSPRYIYEELVRQSPDTQKVWVLNQVHRFTDPNTARVQRLSPRYFWALARAETWVLNQNTPHYIRRPEKTNYIQTWHGTPLKRMQHDMDQVIGRDPGYLDRVSQATAQWSTLLSPSPYATAAFRSAFKYSGPVAELGYPRNDPLCADDRDERAARIRAKLSIRPEQRVVLYAPTFRDNQSSANGWFTFDLELDLERFMREMPNDTVLLLRLHTLIAKGITIPHEYRRRVQDVSKYGEIQDLLLAADVLITDYSSVFFDAAVLNRPIVFYAYDLDDYRDRLRGFYLDYDRDLPGPIVRTEDELWATTRAALSSPLDLAARERFLERFNPREDGHAAQRVVEQLILER